jgi:membrane fusion protein (multidrug efflux system)
MRPFTASRLPVLLWSAVAGFFAAAPGCTKAPPPPTTAVAALPAARVHTAVVHAETAPLLTEVSGTIRPLQRAQIAAKLMGAIEELPLTLGQRVRSGDLLARLAAGDVQARLAQAQSQLNLVRRELERERGLLAQGASTADTVRGLEDRIAVAQATVREAEVMLGYATIRAPFDGIVARKPAEAGDLATPGTTIVELEGTDAFQVEAAIPDSLATSLAPGTTFTAEVPVSGLRFSVTLAELSSAADPDARSVLARFTIPAGSAVRSGQFVRLQLPGPPVRAILVPITALTVAGQMERVFVVGENQRAVLRIVKSGATRADQVEILSGLDAGERVVISPPAGLRDGQPLDLLP